MMEESVTMGERRKMRHVLVLDDSQGRRTLSLEAATYSLGRDTSNVIVLRSDYVSRQHAIIFRVPVPGSQRYLFRILDGNLEGKRSTNGLIVNGQRIYSHDLQHGDLIIFSRDVSAGYYVSANLTDAEFARYVDSVEFRSLKATVVDPFQTSLEQGSIPIPPKRR
ncbi:MAG: hypothetical protein OHK0012_18090 [Synechococcales cyanobacterium]